MKKSKKIILGIILIGLLIPAIVVPIYLINKKDDENNKEKDQKVVDDYLKKLKKLTPKEIIIKETSGSITKNKVSILNAIKDLDNFPSIPSGISLEIKDDSKELALQGIAVTLIVKKGTINKEITGFKAKKSKTKIELDTDSINNVKKILDDKSSKLVRIENVQAKVGASGVANKIVAKLQEAIGLGNLDGATINVKADSTNANIVHTGQGIGFIITLSKGSASQEISNWKVLRTKPTVELNTESINNVKKILDDKSSKLVTIINVEAKVEAIEVSTKIVAKLEEVIGTSNLDGVIISVKADSTNADIIDTGLGTGFIITLSKGTASQEISNWKVLRTKPTSEQNTNSVNNVEKILDDKSSKLVTIINVEAKVEAVGVPAKIVAKLEEIIGTSNLDGVTINVKADITNADIIDTGLGIGFIITLSKGTASQEISNWKVLRTKPTSEQNTESINNVKTILDNKDPKLVTIENVQVKVGASGVANKIVAKLQEAIGLGKLDGVTINVKADNANADIIESGSGTGFIITLSKGSASVEISNWKVKRNLSSQEIIDNFVKKLNALKTKEVTIIETSGSITENKNSIKRAIESLADFPTIPDGLTWKVKDDTKELTLAGVDITLVVQKGLRIEGVKGFFKAKRSQSNQEIVANFIEKINRLITKEVTIIETSGSVTENKNSIKRAIESLADFPTIPDGLTWKVKDDTKELTLAGVDITLVVEKGLYTKEVKGLFKAKRSAQSIQETADQKIVDDFVKKLNALRTKVVKISQTSGSVTENKNSIKRAIESLADFPTIPDGLTWKVKDDTKELTLAGVYITLVVEKGLYNKEIKALFKAKRSAQSAQETTDQKIVDDFVKKLNALRTKEVAIFEVDSGTISEHKELIRSALVNLNDFPTTLPGGLTLEIKNNLAPLTTTGVNITLVVQKGLQTQEVTGFTVKLRKRLPFEQYIKTSYKKLGLEIEISNRVSVNNNGEIQQAIKDHFKINFNMPKEWVTIPDDVNSISQDKANPTKIIVRFSFKTNNVKREFKVWKASS